MIGVALEGTRGPQGPRTADRARRRHRRVDGGGHVRAHRHDAEGVRRPVQRLADKTDAVIGGKEIVKGSTNGSGVTVPAALVERSRALPEVEAAGGTVAPDEVNGADMIGDDGKAVAKESLGMGSTPRTRASARSGSRRATGPRAPARS